MQIPWMRSLLIHILTCRHALRVRVPLDYPVILMQGSHFAAASLQRGLSQPHHSFSSTTQINPRNATPHLLPTVNNQLMFSRFSQLARHFSRPQPNYAHNSAAAFTTSAARIMTSSGTADERNTRTIHTAACLIIGDEVLGGKVRLLWRMLRDMASSRAVG
jgi:hypothetical protein